MPDIMNAPEQFVSELVSGIVLAHPSLHPVDADPMALMWTHNNTFPRVALITGGGSGHLPLFLGYVGDGLCDAVAVGEVFSSPSTQRICAAARAAHRGHGILFVIGNYFGDRLNFDDAVEELAAEGINAAVVRVSDDTASAPQERIQDRRGIAGLALVYKILGAAAQDGENLASLVHISDQLNASLKSLGVAFSGCTLPGQNQPNFTVPSGQVSVGLGIHGEAGIQDVPSMTADELARLLWVRLESELPSGSLDSEVRVAILINSLGGTPLEEVYLLLSSVKKVMPLHYRIVCAYVGRYATSLEMRGASLSVLPLQPEWERWLHSPAFSPLISWNNMVTGGATS